MKDLEQQIRLRILINESMSMSEIQSSFLDTPKRTIIRAVKKLVKSGKIQNKRIHGEGKRKRYALTEEKVKSDITIRAFPEEAFKKNASVDEILAMQIRPKITQRNLSKLIEDEIRFYKKEIRDMEQFGETESYYIYHLSIISNCLEWIMKLTMATNSGMLGDSPVKLELAQENRRRYEKFLVMVCNNIKKYDEKLGENILRQIYTELTNVSLIEQLHIR